MKEKKDISADLKNAFAPQGALMLRSFSLKNYLSFRESAVLDLTAPKTQEEYGWVVRRNGNENLALISGIFGANASGKTNLLRGLYLVLWFLHESFDDSDRYGKIWGMQSWANKGDPCCFKLVWEDASEGRFTYKLEATEEGVCKEELRFLALGERGQGKIIFLRNASGIVSAVSDFAFLASLEVRSNASVISTFLQFNPKSPWRKLGSAVANLTTDRRVYTEEMLQYASEGYFKDPDLKAEMETHLRQFDLDLRIEFEERPASDGVLEIVPVGIHSMGGGKAFRLDFSNESGGTRGLYVLFWMVLPLLKTGGLIILDEIEAELHPNIVEYLLWIFGDDEMNKGHAQLIFTSHSSEIMNLTGKHLTWFTEKEEAQSYLLRLSSFKGVRMEENFSAKYRAGKWGAVPRL